MSYSCARMRYVFPFICLLVPSLEPVPVLGRRLQKLLLTIALCPWNKAVPPHQLCSKKTQPANA